MKLFIFVSIIFIILLVYRYYTGTTRNYKLNLVRVSKIKNSNKAQIIKEEDLITLPSIVQNYLRYVGVVGKEKINDFTINITGEMCLEKGNDRSLIKATQKKFINQGIRLFYMTMKYKGISINGLHHFENGKATMLIKILDLIKIVDIKGDIMDKSETVTFFNDLCVFAPSALIDADVTWEQLNDLEVLATYTHMDISVTAKLYFNEKHQLINFISNDRYEIQSKKNYQKVPWSTPISNYQNFNGYKLASFGEAIWHYKDSNFSYIKMNINNVYYDN